jgi:hypothetical protein
MSKKMEQKPKSGRQARKSHGGYASLKWMPGLQKMRERSYFNRKLPKK